MDRLRALLIRHRRLALSLVALALMVKAIVPVGYMFAPANGTILVSVCNGQGLDMVAIDLGLPADDDGGTHSDGESADQPCAFSGLGMAATSGADVALLAIAVAYLVALGFLPVARSVVRPVTRLRPPLRAPPVLR